MCAIVPPGRPTLIGVATSNTTTVQLAEDPAGLLPRLRELYDTVYARPPHSWTSRESERHHQVLTTLAQRPDFRIAVAEHDHIVIGAVYGHPAAENWWDGVRGDFDTSLTQEWPGRTFLIAGLAVHPERRRQGIGRRLVECLLGGRTEQRITYSVMSGAVGVHRLFGIDVDPVGHKVLPPTAPIGALAVYTLKLPLKRREPDQGLPGDRVRTAEAAFV
jgi:GNAT superfamily N-acetyltransferase